MTHEERAQYAQARAYERMQEDGVLPYAGEDDALREAVSAATAGRCSIPLDTTSPGATLRASLHLWRAFG